MLCCTTARAAFFQVARSVRSTFGVSRLEFTIPSPIFAHQLQGTLYLIWKVNATGFGLISLMLLLAGLRQCNHSTHEMRRFFFVPPVVYGP